MPVMKNKLVPLWKLLREYGKTDKMVKKVTSDDIATMPQLEDMKLIFGQLTIISRADFGSCLHCPANYDANDDL